MKTRSNKNGFMYSHLRILTISTIIIHSVGTQKKQIVGLDCLTSKIINCCVYKCVNYVMFE